ncbi:hypothetical protein [Coraliomargarita parva]|uniref:hypothetical protein n=1 Tax=Coraliomargarita parva TaxID=3014050 RepID=UPI0022B490C9|nr:hypothetical protein [Coraliomargarita parva]
MSSAGKRRVPGETCAKKVDAPISVYDYLQSASPSSARSARENNESGGFLLWLYSHSLEFNSLLCAFCAGMVGSLCLFIDDGRWILPWVARGLLHNITTITAIICWWELVFTLTYLFAALTLLVRFFQSGVVWIVTGLIILPLILFTCVIAGVDPSHLRAVGGVFQLAFIVMNWSRIWRGFLLFIAAAFFMGFCVGLSPDLQRIIRDITNSGLHLWP